jgi:hypothetical protein
MLRQMEIIIESAKITHYLLIPKEKNDKSKFLNELGYALENWQELEADIRKIALENEAVFQKDAPFDGKLFEVKGQLRNLEVITIWLLLESPTIFRFVTLFPNKSNK